MDDKRVLLVWDVFVWESLPTKPQNSTMHCLKECYVIEYLYFSHNCALGFTVIKNFLYDGDNLDIFKHF
mgnify:CR=1 FL=1